ncbi:MAG: tRNA glutamyl-Q(34) synthetase GluQRS [Acetobacteraceae bacterium]
MSIVTRFAPSPTGYLHLGHAHAALFAWRRARAAGGCFLLRLEDIDSTRCRPAFAQAIMDDLAWLGLDWDGDVRVQSRHLAEYRAALDALAARDLLYPCFCTRADIAAAAGAPHGSDTGLYPGTCRRLSADARASRIASGAPYALRLDSAGALDAVGGFLAYEEIGEGPIECRPERFGDAVLGRKDAPASYHLCVTHDDALQGVTLVTRGVDLRPATDLHRLIQTLMGWASPAYAHHDLLTDEVGRRLSKRHGAMALRALRQAGRSAAEVRALAGFAD